MESWEETNWFVIQAKVHCENLAAANVARTDLEVFLPRIKKDQLICGVRRTVTRPLFPGYFFAQFCPLLSLDTVRYARGVLRVVGARCHPIAVTGEVITAIRDRIQEDGFIRVDPKPLRSGEIVAIEQGPFAGWMGKVERECDDGQRTVLLLEAIQQAHVVIEKWRLSRAEACF
jgi:transcriptional antiterminator RfaH